jgi:hypothetical protein
MTSADQTLYCANHPSIQTALRCNRCEKPICAKCAVLTPTGYRCRDCIGSQQKAFDTALWYDYILAFGVASVLSLVGSILVTILPFAFLTILIAPLIGTVIGEAVRRATQKRRSRYLILTAMIGVILGALPTLLIQLLSMGAFTVAASGRGFVGGLFPLVWQGVYLFLATSSAYYRISGIRIRY